MNILGGYLKTRNFFVISLSVLLSLPGVLLMDLSRAQAAYNPSYLISDAEFINAEALDAGGIQSFLNARGGTRLRTFSEGGRSAAQIIADAARANGMNPIVILATIQKEESLVDSNTNFDYRVNWAMGYAVCDSCSLDDPDVVKYKGFTKQIDNATWQLKYNYSQCAVGLCWNSRDWNVGRTMMIDGTAVRFANRATSSLYRYTPHLHGNENFSNIYGQYSVYTAKGAKGVKGSKTATKGIKTKIAKTKVVKTVVKTAKTISKIISKTPQPKIAPSATPKLK